MTSFESIKHLAQDKAMDAIHQRMPDAAREWTEVAAVADAASRGQMYLAARASTHRPIGPWS